MYKQYSVLPSRNVPSMGTCTKEEAERLYRIGETIARNGGVNPLTHQVDWEGNITKKL